MTVFIKKLIKNKNNLRIKAHSKYIMSNITGSFKEQLDASTIKQFEALYNKISLNSEFELMFFKHEKQKMSLENFLKILEYLNYKGSIQKLKLVNLITLDINYKRKQGETFRITITGLEAINR